MVKTVLITGTSSGIGKSCVETFAKAGWNVAATMRKINSELFNHLQNVKVYSLDVTKQSDIDNVMRDAIKDFGAIDVLINNAGYGVNGVFEAMSDDVIHEQFEVNVFGLMRMTRAAIKQMRIQNKGTIIQISSMGGRIVFPLYSIYHGTKWAVEGYSEALAYELSNLNIKVKIIEPGVIKTDFYGRSRLFVKPQHNTTYDNFIAKVEKVSQNAGKKGVPAQKVADKILHAANDQSNKLRYVVGSPAPILLGLRKILPDNLYRFINKISYKI